MIFLRKYILVTFLLVTIHLSAQKRRNGYIWLSPVQFFEKVNNDDNSLILDARLYEDYFEERIADAIWVGEKNDLMMVVKGVSKDRNIYLYCYKGIERGIAVAKILLEEGYKSVYFLEGGIEKWINSGLITITSQP